MNRKVIWSPTAKADLIDIARYLARDDPHAAHTVLARLREAGGALGRAATGRPGRVAGTSEKSVQGLPYIIAYALTPEPRSDAVAILHIIHTARDWRPGGWPV